MGRLGKVTASLCCCALLFSLNLAAQEAASIRFEEISAKSGIRVTHHTRNFHGKKADVLHMFTSGGAAVAIGDYDNDGYEDIFITDSDAGRPNHLFHNNGDMTFTDVAEQAGVAGGNVLALGAGKGVVAHPTAEEVASHGRRRGRDGFQRAMEVGVGHHHA